MQESGEMYLENILLLGRQNNLVRASMLAEKMAISKASVSRALARLKQDACLIVDEEGYIALTEKGRRIAETIYERHCVLTQVFISLGVDPQTAEADACRVEHRISAETFAAVKARWQQTAADK